MCTLAKFCDYAQFDYINRVTHIDQFTASPDHSFTAAAAVGKMERSGGLTAEKIVDAPSDLRETN